MTPARVRSLLFFSDALDAAALAGQARERAAWLGGEARGYARGRADGYAAAIAEIKAVQRELVGGLGRLGDALAARSHLCCPSCRRTGHRPGCPDCQDRTAAAWSAPMPGDYPGGRPS